MRFLKNFDWSFKSILKALGVLLLGLAAISVAIMLVGFALDTVFNRSGNSELSSRDADYSYNGAYLNGGVAQAPSIYPPAPESAPGDDLEAFEVKEYQGRIETRNLERDCQVIADLKSREDVIFENSDQNQENCYFRFKVKKESTNEIVALIERMDPEYFNDNTQTIKGAVDYYEGQKELLERELEELEKSFQEALESYETFERLATTQGDTESLAQIITEKPKFVQEFTQKRAQLKNQITSLERQQSDQLDRLDYTFFNLTIQKDRILDWQRIGDTWEYEVKELVRHFNGMIQGLTVVLLQILIRVFQGAVYFFLALFVLKGLWMGTKRIWRIGGGKR